MLLVKILEPLILIPIVINSKNTKGGLKTSNYDWVNEGLEPTTKRGYFNTFKMTL